jgi:hypothetical protein
MKNDQEAPIERHWSPQEIGSAWGLHPDTVRRLFEREPGVLVVSNAGSVKRRHRTLRIPDSVVERVHRRLENPDSVAPRAHRRLGNG